MRNGKVALTALATALLMAACGGEAGPAGASSIIETVNESAGENCAQGGITIRTGVDADGDGTLSDTEVDSTSYVCNGDQGEQGDQGNKGDQGDEGATALVETAEATTCGDAGGTLIRVGVDTNDDGSLQDSEVTSEEEICNAPDAVDAPILIREVDVPQGDVCGGGGTAVQVGRDLDGSGTLEEAEVESEILECGPCPDGFAEDPNDPNQCVVLTMLYFEGTIDSVRDDDSLNPGVNVGDTFTGMISYPGFASPTDSNSDGRMGVYTLTGENVSYSVNLEGNMLTSSPNAELTFEFNNDFGYTHQDEYRVSSTANEDFNGLDVSGMTLALYDSDGTVFADDHFRAPMPFTEAEQRQFMIQFSEGLDSGNGGPGPGPITTGSIATAFGTLTTVTVQ